jgi:hypothetical protein
LVSLEAKMEIRAEYHEAGCREQQIRSLTKRAQKLGLQLVVPKTA